MAGMKLTGYQTVEARRGARCFLEVGKMQGTSWFENAKGLPQGASLCVWLHMVKNECGENSVERCIVVGELLGVAFIKLDREAPSECLSAGAGHSLRVGVDAHEVGGGH